jgi:hypothetical protein
MARFPADKGAWHRQDHAAPQQKSAWHLTVDRRGVGGRMIGNHEETIGIDVDGPGHCGDRCAVFR